MTLARADVVWAFRTYLGRDPEDEAAIEAHLLHGTPERLREVLFRAEERQNRGVSPALRGGLYCQWRPGAPRLTLLGNCQAPVLAEAIAAMSDWSVCGMEVLDHAARPDFYRAEAADAEHLVCAVLSDNFGDLARDRLAAARPDTVFFSPAFFYGQHPDMAYWGERGARVPSPLGDYHSAVVLRAFLDGLSAADCLDRFSTKGLDRLGLIARGLASLVETQRREEGLALRFADLIDAHWREHPLFLTINHPTSALLAAMAGRILKHLGAAPQPLRGFHNRLEADVLWPITPEVRDTFGLAIEPWRHYARDGVVLSREEFVFRSYEIYAGYDRDDLLSRGAPDHRRALGLV